MLSVIWGILKALGLLLAAILALFLVVFLAVLFVPLRYEFTASGRYGREAGEAEYQAKARISWLFRLVCIRIRADREGMQMKMRLFGIPVGGRKEQKESRPEKKGRRKQAGKKKEQKKEQQKKEQPQREQPQKEQIDPAGDIQKASADQENAEVFVLEEKTEEPAGEESEKKKQNLFQKILSFFHKIWNFFWGLFQNLCCTFKKICDKIKGIFGMAEEIRDFLTAEENREAFQYVKGEAGKLFKHILPKKFSGEIRFGLEDPATTGKILMYLGVAYPFLGKRLSITPVFENRFYLEGNVFLKGRIRAFSLLIIGIRVWFNKKFRGLLERGRGLKEQLGRT